MNDKELKQKYASDFSELRKLINSWNFIPGAPNDEFDSLFNKVLSHLYKSSDFEKIVRVISSELTVKYAVEWSSKEGVYSQQHSSKPITLAYGLNDSPIGLTVNTR